GSVGDSAVAVSDGLLRMMNERELLGVLAHEVSHIANRDLWIMGLADGMARVTSLASTVGLFLLFLNLPLMFAGVAQISWISILVLVFSPTVISLLQLSLSRSREFEADLGSAHLTGDPAGLASALAKLERRTGRFWEEILLPGRRSPDPCLLRTHPPTKERIKRLAELVPPAPRSHTRPDMNVGLTPPFPIVVTGPRWRRTGMWY
ncbi:MAG: zinc metalloprotease HtpX, partial [Pseudomonadota bacterium]